MRELLLALWFIGAATQYATFWTPQSRSGESLAWRLAFVACWPALLAARLLGALLSTVLTPQPEERRA